MAIPAPSLAFQPCIVQAEEPTGVQKTFLPCRSAKALFVGLPDREKSISTPCSQAWRCSGMRKERAPRTVGREDEAGGRPGAAHCEHGLGPA